MGREGRVKTSKTLGKNSKTQGKNPKLKEKIQPLGATLLKFEKLKKKTHLLAKFPGVPLNKPFLLPNIFKKGNILEIVLILYKKKKGKVKLSSPLKT